MWDFVFFEGTKNSKRERGNNHGSFTKNRSKKIPPTPCCSDIETPCQNLFIPI